MIADKYMKINPIKGIFRKVLHDCALCNIIVCNQCL